MSLQPGQMLAHYRVAAKIGEGGMGEVWRAEDTKLGRRVALKLLPQAVASDPARLARFRREATLLASLNHPNIAAIHGLEDSSGAGALVLELVEGETLSQRIAAGPLPFDEARTVALQIAAALAAAHDKGIIHRDLKPDNVKFTAGGQVKVLDFGLAKAMDDAPTSSSLTQSPTLTTDATREGVLMGTASYMSPEQAKGKTADRRADVWAFGCVLFEMLSGGKVFRGETLSEIIAEILKTEPDWNRLPADLPAGARRLLRRCLSKDPARRLHDISDARIELEEAEIAETATTAASPAPAGGMSRWWLWLLAGATAGALIMALWPQRERPSGPGRPSAEPVRRAEILLQPGPADVYGPSITLSPDGKTLVYAGIYGPGRQRLYRRDMHSLDWQPIPGTEQAVLPFFSPDGSRIGFIAGGEIKTISLDGSDVKVVCAAHQAGDAVWTESGWIYFTQGESNLARVRETGGQPESIEGPDRYQPCRVPGRDGVLVTQIQSGEGISKERSRLVFLGDDGSTREILKGGYNARVLRSGHLIFARGTGLFAVGLDLETLEAQGAPLRVVPEVWTDSVWAWARYDVADDGTLVYMPGPDLARTVPAWLAPGAEPEPLAMEEGIYNTFQLSPDQTRLAIQVAAGQDQIHIYDSRRHALNRLTLEGGSSYPVWSRDGRSIFYSWTENPGEAASVVVEQPVDGGGPARPLMTAEQVAVTGAVSHWPNSLTPDGETLLMMTWGHPSRGGDIYVLPTSGGEPRPLLATDATEIIPMISPDGRHFVYLSNKGGAYEIYVRPFPDAGTRVWQISSGGGFDARWSPTGDAIYYRAGEQLMRVPYTADPEFVPGSPEPVMIADFHDSAGISFEISLDGKRFLGNRPAVSMKDADRLVLVTGWQQEISRLVPPPGS